MKKVKEYILGVNGFSWSIAGMNLAAAKHKIKFEINRNADSRISDYILILYSRGTFKVIFQKDIGLYFSSSELRNLFCVLIDAIENEVESMKNNINKGSGGLYSMISFKVYYAMLNQQLLKEHKEKL